MASYPVNLYDGSATELQAEMLPGESLLWSGKPSRRVIFHRNDLMAIPFSLLWGGFAIFWEWGVTGLSSTSHRAPDFFSLWGIPFVVIGQYMIWGRFLYIAWKKGYTFYGVTNKRVIVLATGSGRRVRDSYFSSLTSVAFSERSDGIGTIEFSPDPYNAFNRSFGRSGRIQLDISLSSLTFFDIPNARGVYQIIQGERAKI